MGNEMKPVYRYYAYLNEYIEVGKKSQKRFYDHLNKVGGGLDYINGTWGFLKIGKYQYSINL